MDSRLKDSYKQIFLISLVVLMFGLCIYIYLNDSNTLEKSLEHINGDPLTFNYESGFYNHDLEIKISKDIEIPFGAKIYYTLNGNNPTNNDNKYNGVINLQLKDNISIYSVKAVVYFKGEYSEIEEKCYVIAKDIYNDFDLPIMNITIDSDDLYNEEYGMMIEKNYNNNSEEFLKDSRVFLFDTDGNIMMNQKTKIELTGFNSVYAPVKSFKIRKNKEYEEKIKFSYNEEMSKFSIIDSYNNLKIRSGGQDRTRSNIRESYFSRIAEESNFDGYSKGKRCIVFLNCKFYGVFDIEQNYSKSFLGDRYGIKDDENIEVYGETDDESLEKADIMKYFKADLNVLENRKKLEEYVDMNNYLLYYAIQILGSNVDMPNKNVKFWRYTGEYDENNKYKDGKIRYLLYDMDLTYYTEDTWVWDWKISNPNRLELLKDSKFSFKYVMRSKYYRNLFITIVCDLINTSFTDNNILTIINEEYNKIDSSNKKFLSEYQYNHTKDCIDDMKKQSIEAKKVTVNTIENIYGLNEKYDLTIKCEKGIKAYWNNMEVFEENSYSNKYYKGVSFEMSYEEYPGYEFDYWLVNDKKIYDKNLNINDELIKEDRIDIKLVAKRNDNIKLIISEINAKDDSDWIKLTNIGEENIELSDYYISDNEKKLLKNQLPKLLLQSGESVIINGNKNYFAMGDYICNFNLSQGETLYLYNVNADEIEDRIVIPRMSSIETYGRYLNSGTYMFYNNMDNVRKTSTY